MQWCETILILSYNKNQNNAFQFRPIKMGGSSTRPAPESGFDSNPSEDKTFTVVKHELFSLVGNKWSISSIGGNKCSFSGVWLFPGGEAEDGHEFDIAGKVLVENSIYYYDTLLFGC